MEKKGVLIILSLFLINFVSAQFGFGYGSFSFRNFFDSLDPATVTYSLLFIAIFTLVYLALTRISLFRTTTKSPWGIEETSTNNIAAGMLSFSVSALIVYYLYKSGYNVNSLFYSLGFTGDLFSLVTMIAAVLFSIFLIIKFKSRGLFIILGLLLILVAIFTDLIYEKGIALIIGAILIIIGIFIGNYGRRRGRRMGGGGMGGRWRPRTY